MVMRSLMPYTGKKRVNLRVEGELVDVVRRESAMTESDEEATT